MRKFEQAEQRAKEVYDSRHPHAFEGVRRLMAAVLEDAITAMRAGGRASSQARHWLLSNDREWLFSFESLCEALGIDPNELRRNLFRMSHGSDGSDEPTVTDERKGDDERPDSRAAPSPSSD